MKQLSCCVFLLFSFANKSCRQDTKDKTISKLNVLIVYLTLFEKRCFTRYAYTIFVADMTANMMIDVIIFLGRDSFLYCQWMRSVNLKKDISIIVLLNN